ARFEKNRRFPRFFKSPETPRISPKIPSKPCKFPVFPEKKLEIRSEPGPDDHRLQTNPKDTPAFPAICRGVFLERIDVKCLISPT
ncbi:MAG: hypothetical protein OXE98_04740, partial [Hyphomicrobiales bacterium]|nr:hypothetical protein [Hyphomicrobiales bacterium]